MFSFKMHSHIKLNLIPVIYRPSPFYLLSWKREVKHMPAPTSKFPVKVRHLSFICYLCILPGNGGKKKKTFKLVSAFFKLNFSYESSIILVLQTQFIITFKLPTKRMPFRVSLKHFWEGKK